MAFKHIKYTVVDAFRSLEEKCVSEAVKDGTESSKGSKLFPCSSNKFLLNLRLSISRFLINLFLIKSCIYTHILLTLINGEGGLE